MRFQRIKPIAKTPKFGIALMAKFYDVIWVIKSMQLILLAFVTLTIKYIVPATKWQ